VDQLRVWREYIETAEIMRNRLSAQLQGESALSSGDYQVLLALSEAPQRTLRSAELAAVIEWERSRLSHHLGRMEKRGLIARAACADDPHGVDVTGTRDGMEQLRAASVPHLRAVKELFIDALTPEQLDAVDDIVRSLRAHLAAPRA
jgi:DNA-binding MarR family transcriptional regulator